MLLTLTEKLVDGYFASIPRCMPHSCNVDNALLIAHRGAHDFARGIVENTRQAFKLAKELGCWGIEFDIQVTADGVLVVNHDQTLSRLWNHDVAIAQLSFKELCQLEPGIPSLAEVVAEYGGNMHLFIELKAPFQAEDALVQTLKDLSPGTDYHLLTLNDSVFNHLIHFPGHSLLLVAVHNNVREFCELSIKKHYGGVLGNYLLLTDKYREKLKKVNQVSGIGFVNSKNSLYRELSRGISWIFTDQALLVSRYLQDLRQK